jgi:hypothetical protein
VDIVQSPDCLDLDDDTFLHQQVSDKVPDQNILVANFDPALLGSVKARVTKLHSQRILVNLFQKSGAERIAYLMDAADDLLGNLVQL